MAAVMLDEYAGSVVESHELVGDNENWRVEVDYDDPTRCVLVWTEYLDFHIGSRGLTVLVGEDGFPTPDMVDATEQELRRLLGTHLVYVDAGCGDEPAFEVAVPVDVPSGTLGDLAELVWPYVATLTNVTDPGTFGSEYVMGTVARNLEG